MRRGSVRSYRQAALGGGVALLVVTVMTLELAAPSSRPRYAAQAGCAWRDGRGIADRGTARGDVDGDQRVDVVSVIANYSAAAGCRLALRVRLAGGRVLLDRLDEKLVAATARELRKSLSPRLTSLAAIDTAPGAEIVVHVNQGASTSFVSVYTVREGELVGYRVAGRGADHSFAYGAGGVGTGVDCWRGSASGYVVASEAKPNNRGWAIRRSVYRASGDTFLSVPSQKLTRTVETVEEFPELEEPTAFRRCTVARARHA